MNYLNLYNSNNFKIKCLLGSLCPPSNPYVFMWGKYCCSFEEEGYSTENIDSCNGGELSVNSTCCKSNRHIKCMSDLGCKNRRGIQNIMMLKAAKCILYAIVFSSISN